MAGRPGITAGPVADTVFAGRPAKTMTYDVGHVDGAVPCHSGDDRACLSSVTNPQAGLAYQDYEGTTVTLYQIDVAGLTLVVAVSELPGAAQFAATITVAEGKPAAGTADAIALERTGPLAEGVTYFWDRSSIGTYKFIGDPAVKVGPFAPPVAHWVTLAHGQSEACMSISDGTQDVINQQDPGGGGHAAGPVTADLVNMITKMDFLHLLGPATPVSVGDVAATAIEVTGEPGGLVIGGGLMVAPGTKVRIVVIPRDGDAAPDVVMVELGSPCQALFDSLTLELAK